MQIFIKTFGCSANQADSEAMAGLLAKAKHKLVDSPDKADIIIINSCFVKGPTECAVWKAISQVPKSKKLIVAGCMADGRAKEILEKYPRAILVGTHNISKILEALNSGKSFVGKSKACKINLPRIRKNRTIAIVPIASGCLGNCTYCCVKKIKGELRSYPEKLILKETKAALDEGCKEIWLTAQDCAAYGLDKGTNLAELLKKICKIPKKFFIRVGMSNPNNIGKVEKQLILAYKNPKVFKFLHIPLQAGSDKVLGDMNRFYVAKDFKKLISKFKKSIPNLTISTDIICGFPTESDEDFIETLKLIKWLQPDVLNISQFWPRPGTPAASIAKQLLVGKPKERSRALSVLYDELALKKNQSWLGWKGEVLIDEVGKKGGFVARNFAYKPIILTEKNLKVGEFVKVKIIEARKNYLLGTLKTSGISQNS